jgi:hypothetical protein
MALNSSGAISLGGSAIGVSINAELGISGTIATSLNDVPVRTLAGKLSGAIVMPTDFWGKSNHVPLSTKVTFTTNTSWVVPSGITSINVKAWGAGAGQNPGQASYSITGGGGFASATVSVTPGSTLLVAVGGGGQLAAGGTNGGGTGANGGGGGYSAVFNNNTASQVNALIVAGGGGSMAGGTGTQGWFGGGGGGAAGHSGNDTGTLLQGGGGTQTAGGTAYVATGYSGGEGAALRGGSFVSPLNAFTGGGGGYFGGGAGSKAGGGSGYVTGTNTQNIATGVATPIPANTSDIDYIYPKGYGTAQYGGAAGMLGNDGYVVIYW